MDAADTSQDEVFNDPALWFGAGATDFGLGIGRCGWLTTIDKQEHECPKR